MVRQDVPRVLAATSDSVSAGGPLTLAVPEILATASVSEWLTFTPPLRRASDLVICSERTLRPKNTGEIMWHQYPCHQKRYDNTLAPEISLSLLVSPNTVMHEEVESAVTFVSEDHGVAYLLNPDTEHIRTLDKGIADNVGSHTDGSSVAP